MTVPVINLSARQSSEFTVADDVAVGLYLIRVVRRRLARWVGSSWLGVWLTLYITMYTPLYRLILHTLRLWVPFLSLSLEKVDRCILDLWWTLLWSFCGTYQGCVRMRLIYSLYLRVNNLL